jgi:hypothetical protein
MQLYSPKLFLHAKSKRGSYKGWDGVVRLFSRGSFPIGLLSRVEKVLKKDMLASFKGRLKV